MSIFYVGQRVRIVRTNNFPQLEGVETRVTRLNSIGTKKNGCSFIGTEILETTPGTYLRLVAHEYQLEPMVPRNEPGSWEEIDKLLPKLRELVT